MLVAVSGGRDSVALLHALHALGHEKLTVIHLDHGLRGRVSTADAKFVAKLADRLGYPHIIGRADVRGYAAERGISIETAARELRHAFFESCARRTRCRTVLLAHHADDQAETCLFNFLRGSGAVGLAGMKSESTIRVGRSAITLVRPLLPVRRNEIDAYIRRHAIRYREDATNSLLDATRNRLRHRVIPAIREAMGDSSIDAILRAAEIFGAENEWMEAEAEKFEMTTELSVKELRELPIGLQRRVLRRWLGVRGVEDSSFDVVEGVRGLLEPGARTAKVNLPAAKHCRRRAGWLFVE